MFGAKFFEKFTTNGDLGLAGSRMVTSADEAGGGDAGGDKRPAVTFGARLSPTTAAIAAAVARVAALAHCAATFAASAAANAAFAFAVATAVGVCGINWFEWFAANGAVDAVDTTFVCARLSGVKNIS